MLVKQTLVSFIIIIHLLSKWKMDKDPTLPQILYVQLTLTF
jgi:hypothetical protein